MTEYYQDEAVTLYRGDSRELLAVSPGFAVDVVLTDPPYDEATHSGARSSTDLSHAIPFGFEPADVEQVIALCMPEARRWVVIFCALEMLGAYQQADRASWVRAGMWRRTNGAPQFTGDRPGQPGEGLAILHRPGRKRWNGGGSPAFWEGPVARSNRVHPAQKPDWLMDALVFAFTEPGETVLDPFAGSGTTLVSAKRLGRKAIGIEIEERWCAVAARRLAQGVLPMEY